MAPYEKWQYYDNKVQQQEQDHNYALNKTKKVAWFVSNCGARNGRLHYAHELQKHIEVIALGGGLWGRECYVKSKISGTGTYSNAYIFQGTFK